MLVSPRQRRLINPTQARSTYGLLNSLVVPRAIAWVSSRSPDGVDNLAPHSFFTIVSSRPPLVLFASIGYKDTLRNIEQTGEFVVCGAPQARLDAVNLTAVDFPADVSEFDEAGLTREPSELVAPCRVAESPYALECRLVETRRLGDGISIVGEIVWIAIDESVLIGDRVSSALLDPVARLGSSEWSGLGPIMVRKRLTLADVRDT